MQKISLKENHFHVRFLYQRLDEYLRNHPAEPNQIVRVVAEYIDKIYKLYNHYIIIYNYYISICMQQ